MVRVDSMNPLWTCSACGRSFANRNQAHTCAALDLEHHFVGRDAKLRELYAAFLAALRKFGPVTVLPEKTRIAFQTRISFAQLTPRKSYFVGHLVLAQATPSPLFFKIETFSPRNHVHHFKLVSVAQAEAPEFASLLAQAYSVGEQLHLGSRARSAA